MIGSERRLTARAQCISDIVFEPNIGGIVLNVSEGGLGFHSIDSIRRDGTMRFSWSLQNRPIKGAGELAWIDEAGKTGGLRFIGLAEDIREEIRRWMRQQAAAADNESTPAQISSLRSLPGLGVEAVVRDDDWSQRLAKISQGLGAP